MPKDTNKPLLKAFRRVLCTAVALCLVSPVSFGQGNGGEEEDFPTWVLPGFDATPTDEIRLATEFTYTPPPEPEPEPTVVQQVIVTQTPQPIQPTPAPSTSPAPVLTPTPATTTESAPASTSTLSDPEPAQDTGESYDFFVPSIQIDPTPVPDPEPTPTPAPAPATTQPSTNAQPSIFGTPKPPAPKPATTSTLGSAPKPPSSSTSLFASSPTPAPTPKPTPAPAPKPTPASKPVVVAQPAPAPKPATVSQPKRVQNLQVKRYTTPVRKSAGVATKAVAQPVVSEVFPTSALPYDREKTHLVGKQSIDVQIESFLLSQTPTFLERISKQFPWILLLILLAILYKTRKKIQHIMKSTWIEWKQNLRASIHKFMHWFIDHYLPGFYHERKDNPVLFTKRKI